MSFLAVLIGIAGAVALSGTLVINVIERTREIGVMRAIVTVLAIVASWSPAQKAAQTSVRESLAYA